MNAKDNNSPFPTPHIAATPNDIADVVLMPGDPLRSEYIAKNFLQDAKLFNNVRGICGYTGVFHGAKVSVMASGMGMPSIGIYSHELFNFFGVERIIRVGSAGAMQTKVKIRDIVLGMGACTDSNYAHQFGLHGQLAPIADYAMLRTAADEACAMGLSYHVGNLLSSDVFYSADPEENKKWRRLGVLAIEMEAAALYMNAAYSGRSALAVCTVSDHLITGEHTTSDERQSSFNEMIELALRVAVK